MLIITPEFNVIRTSSSTTPQVRSFSVSSHSVCAWPVHVKLSSTQSSDKTTVAPTLSSGETTLDHPTKPKTTNHSTTHSKPKPSPNSTNINFRSNSSSQIILFMSKSSTSTFHN